MAKTRATASNVTVSLGLVSFPVDLVPATRSKATKADDVSTKMVCPTCAPNELNTVEQRYHCSTHAEHGPFAPGDVARALVVGGELRPVEPGQLQEVAGSAPSGVADLTVYPAGQVEEHTMPSGNIYRLRAKGSPGHYGLMLELVADRNVAFLTEVTNKGATKLYRLIARHGALVLVELVRPSEFHEPEPVEVVLDEKLLPAGRALVESMLDEFDPANFADLRKTRLVALAAQVAPEIEVPAERPAVSVAADLMELLRRSVQAAA